VKEKWRKEKGIKKLKKKTFFKEKKIIKILTDLSKI